MVDVTSSFHGRLIFGEYTLDLLKDIFFDESDGKDCVITADYNKSFLIEWITNAG